MQLPGRGDQHSVKILANKPGLRDRIVALLLDVDSRCAHTEKQKALLRCDVLEVLDSVYEDVSERKGVHEFIRSNLDSISPKARRKSNELVRKHGLQ